MDGKKPKLAHASPGGAKATSAKKRRLEALERQATQGGKRQGVPKAGGDERGQSAADQPPPQPPPGQAQQGRPNTYDPLPDAVWQGPVGAGLKAGSKGRAPQRQQQQQQQPADAGAAVRRLPLRLATQADFAEERALADIGGQLDTNELLAFPKQAKGARPQAPGPRLLSGAALRRAGLQLQRSELTRAAVATLHSHWRAFAQSLAGAGQPQAPRLVRILEDQMDFHGCELTVESAANPRHVGVTGVIVRNAAAAVTLAATSDSDSPPAATGGSRQGAAADASAAAPMDTAEGSAAAASKGSESGAAAPMETAAGSAAAAAAAADVSEGSEGGEQQERPLRVLVLPKAGSLFRMRFPTAAGDAVVQLTGTALRVPGR